MEDNNSQGVSFNWMNIVAVLVFLFIVVAGFVYIASNTQPSTSPFEEEEFMDFDTFQNQEGQDNIQEQENVEGAEDINMDTDQLQVEDLTVGGGEEAVPGKRVTVNYEGTLTNGTKFDSSYDRGEPFTFNLGAGQVIKGWDLGVAGMKIGGKRKLTIPSEFGYGAAGAGSIPPNSTLIFTVELLAVE